jgi:hypothetical protein
MWDRQGVEKIEECRFVVACSFRCESLTYRIQVQGINYLNK